MRKSCLFTLMILLATSVAVAQNNIFPTPTGNVGVGISPAEKKFHVVGTSMFDGTTIIKGGNQLRFYSDVDGPYFSESYGIRAYPYYNSHSFMVLQQPLFVGYESDGTNIDSYDGSLMLSNRLGIGTKTPTRKVTINSLNSSTLVDIGFFQGGVEKGLFGVSGATNDFFAGTVAGDMSIKSTTGPLHLGANSAAPAATFLGNGNLGIGLLAPTRKLAINSLNSSTLVDLGFFQGGVERGLFGVSGASNDFFAGTAAGDMSIKSTTGPLHLGANSAAPAATFLGNGNLGIGVIAPSAKFHTNGTLRFQGLANNNALDQILVTDVNGNVSYRNASSITGTAGWGYGGNTVATLKTFGTMDNFDLPLITNNTERMRISSTGAVLIGTDARPTGAPATGAMLAIKGHIYAEKLKITLTDWADYVFDEEYKLRSLTEVERFIKQNHHLPEVPSAVEVEKNGIDVGENQTILLKKVEELTLYLIEQNKKLEAQQKQIDDLKKELLRKK